MWIEDQILRFLQGRCKHPDNMVAVDIMEGATHYDITYCNRCGAVQIRHADWSDERNDEWRLPDPNLWRGR